jgi:hypothetical protein
MAGAAEAPGTILVALSSARQTWHGTLVHKQHTSNTATIRFMFTSSPAQEKSVAAVTIRHPARIAPAVATYENTVFTYEPPDLADLA